MKQVKKAVDANDMKALEKISVKYKGELAAIINGIQKSVLEIGKKTAAAEMAVKIPPTKKEITAALKLQTTAVIDKFVNELETATKNTL